MKEEAFIPDITECISKFKLTFKDVPDQDIKALFTDTVIKFYKKGEYNPENEHSFSPSLKDVTSFSLVS